MYIKRDAQGRIQAISQQPADGFIASQDGDSFEMQQFVNGLKTQQQLTLEQSDQAMARVLEDVINLLIDKGILRFTDLPPAAQNKLLARRELRGKRQGVDLLDDEDLLNL